VALWIDRFPGVDRSRESRCGHGLTCADSARSLWTAKYPLAPPGYGLGMGSLTPPSGGGAADARSPDHDSPQRPPDTVEVRRSSRRRRTVSAFRDGDRTVVLLPARMSRAEEQHWVAVMLERLATRERRQRPSDDDLARRARMLSQRYLGGRAKPSSLRWVSNQNGRWGSCSVDERSIRLSHRLQAMPAYVVDYVLLHELVHLLVPGHGPAFWEELSAYPHTDRARGYLDGWSQGVHVGDVHDPGTADSRADLSGHPVEPDVTQDACDGDLSWPPVHDRGSATGAR